MTVSDFFWGLGDFFYATFELISLVGNAGNVFFIIVGVIMVLFWMKEMSRYNKEAAQNGTIK